MFIKADCCYVTLLVDKTDPWIATASSVLHVDLSHVSQSQYWS